LCAAHAKAHIANSDNRARAIKRIVNNIPSNPGQGINWRSTRPSDLKAIQKIASVAHPELSERLEIFAEKLNLFPEGCFVLVQGRIVAGYAFVHPWHLNAIPKLDEFLVSLPTNPDCLLIHDVVVLQQARGKGASQSLVELISRLAKKHNLQFLTLVSVYGSHLLWARYGFEPATGITLAPKLTWYGETARFMVRRLDW
jgi:GNAT superfamily N-acetyltransferase